MMIKVSKKVKNWLGRDKKLKLSLLASYCLVIVLSEFLFGITASLFITLFVALITYIFLSFAAGLGASFANVRNQKHINKVQREAIINGNKWGVFYLVILLISHGINWLIFSLRYV